MPENFFLSQLEAALNKNLVFKMTKGEQIRDYLNIEDLIKFISCLCTKENLNTCVLNICSGKGRKLIDIAYEIAKNLGKENLIDAGTIPYRENEIWEMVGDNTKLLKLLKIIDSNLS
jgi:nucleoside-diphosphate-sugar epimerase